MLHARQTGRMVGEKGNGISTAQLHVGGGGGGGRPIISNSNWFYCNNLMVSTARLAH